MKDDITALLGRWRSGDRNAEADLMRVVYPIMRDLARARLRRMPSDFTLRATELANEAYKSGKGILEIIREKKILSEAQIKELLDPVKLSGLDRSKYQKN